MENEEQTKSQSAGWARSPIWLILFALVSAAVIIGAVLGKPLFKFGAKSPAVASKQYLDDDQGFSLTYPGKWHKLNAKEIAAFDGAFAFAIRRSRPHALFSIKSQKVQTKSVDLNQVAKSLDEAMPKSFKNFKKINEKLFEINRRPALKYDYIFTAESALEVREQLIVVDAGDKVFHLTAWSNAKDFSRIEPDFSKVISSFAIR